MTFRKQHAPAVCHTHYRNQPQPSQVAGSQDTSYLKTKKNAQPFHKHRRPWHKPKAQEQSQSTWKTAAAAALTAACLTEELRQHPRVRDSLQAPDKLCMAPQHGDRPFQCHRPDGLSPSALALIMGCSFSKACKACWLGPNENTF